VSSLGDDHHTGVVQDIFRGHASLVLDHFVLIVVSHNDGSALDTLGQVFAAQADNLPDG
jgi:hypothetical protein